MVTVQRIIIVAVKYKINLILFSWEWVYSNTWVFNNYSSE